MIESSSEHWDKIFSKTDDLSLGWYENDLSQTFQLLELVPHWQNSQTFLVGIGTSTLIEQLLEAGVQLSVNDISSTALNKVKARLGNQSKDIHWLCQDISKPLPNAQNKNMNLTSDLWIDRAVLHFLTAETSIQGYFANLKTQLKQGGYAIFAEFSSVGATKCAGLDLHRYSVSELSERLGPSFELIKSFDYIYTNPNGEPRPYTYCLFKRHH